MKRRPGFAPAAARGKREEALMVNIVVNGTPLWATDYNGVDYNRYQRKLGAKRFEERLLAYGDVVRSGATLVARFPARALRGQTGQVE